jgi:hypothetical protein
MTLKKNRGGLSKPALGLLAFVALRVLLAGLSLRDPTGGVLIDSQDYLALSNALVQSGRYVDPNGAQTDLVRPPGYPGFLAAVRLMAGPSSAAATALQLALTGAAALAVWRVGIRVGRESVGLVAAWLVALSPNVAVWSLTLMSEALFCSLMAVALWLWVRGWDQPRPVTLILLGLISAGAAFVRPIGLLLIPVWVLATFVGLKARSGWTKAAALAGLCLLAAAGPVVGWMARNQIAEGQFVFTTVSSKTLVGFDLAEVVARGEGITRSQAAAQLSSQGGLGQVPEVALRYPGPFLRAQLLGVARTAAGTDIGTWGNVLTYDRWAGLGLLTGLFGRTPGADYSAAPASAGEAILRGGLLVYSLVFTLTLGFLCLLGLAPLVRRTTNDVHVEALSVILSVILLLAPLAAGQARFRVPAEPFLAWLAAGGLMVGRDAWRARRASVLATTGFPQPDSHFLQTRVGQENSQPADWAHA